MPAERNSLQLTRAYRDELVDTRTRTSRAAARIWHLDPDDLDRSYRRWHEGAVLITESGQARAVGLADGYLGAFVASETGQDTGPPGIRPEQYVGRTRDGRPLAALLIPPLFTVKVALSQGRTFTEASQRGQRRALRSIAFEVLEAARAAFDDHLKRDRRIVGWRRVTTGGACGACIAAATGAIQRREAIMSVHRGCRCVKEPVIRNVRERWRQPNGKEMFASLTLAAQNQLFEGRGGEAKAELVRSGAVPLEALLTTDPEVLGDDGITETTLVELERLAH